MLWFTGESHCGGSFDYLGSDDNGGECGVAVAITHKALLNEMSITKLS